jgi:hypothetical protein
MDTLPTIITVTRIQKLVTKVHVDKLFDPLVVDLKSHSMKEIRAEAIDEAKFQIINNQNMDLDASSETYKITEIV